MLGKRGENKLTKQQICKKDTIVKNAKMNRAMWRNIFSLIFECFRSLAGNLISRAKCKSWENFVLPPNFSAPVRLCLSIIRIRGPVSWETEMTRGKTSESLPTYYKAKTLLSFGHLFLVVYSNL